MPRGIDLFLPFPNRISPDVKRARSMHLEWPRKFGLLVSAQAADRHVQANYPELAGRFNPNVVGQDLDLVVDLMSWFFLFDDLFDGPPGRDPQRVAELVGAVVDMLDGTPSEDAPPIVSAFFDLWQRSREGMPPRWQARAAENWRVYLAGHVTEAHHRAAGTHLGVAGHLRLRRDTIGVGPTVDLAERAGHFELPQQVHDSSLCRLVRNVATEIVVIHNDMCSVEKEERQGDPHNLVLILERDEGLNRVEAVARMCSMIRERMERYLRLEAELLVSRHGFGLTTDEYAAVERYCVDVLRTLIRGDFDWAEQSGRYATEESP